LLFSFLCLLQIHFEWLFLWKEFNSSYLADLFHGYLFDLCIEDFDFAYALRGSRHFGFLNLRSKLSTMGAHTSKGC
jgi:hypothetical protein